MIIKIKKILTNNWKVKLGSIMVSVGLYWFVSIQQSEHRYFRIPIEVKNLPSEFAIVNNIPNILVVGLKGQKNLLDTLEPRQFYSWIDLKNARIGQFSVPVEFNKVVIPKNLEIMTQIPEYIEVRLEKIIKEYKKVYPKLIGKLPDGFQFSTPIKVVPEKVLIAGPESFLNSLAECYTLPIDLSDYKTSIVVERGLDIDETKFVVVDTNLSVNVKLEIYETFLKKRIDKLKLTYRNLNHNLVIIRTNREISIRISGRYTIISSLTAKNFKPYVNLKDITRKGIYTLKVQLDPIRYVRILNIEPAEVEITLIKH